MVYQEAFWLYSVIHSGTLGVDRNKGHEIVMKKCDGDDDDRETAGKNTFSPLFSKTQHWLVLPLFCFKKKKKESFPSPFHYFCMIFLSVSLLPYYFYVFHALNYNIIFIIYISNPLLSRFFLLFHHQSLLHPSLFPPLW